MHNLRVDLPYGHGSGNHGNHDHGEADHAGVVTGLGDTNGGVKDDGGYTFVNQESDLQEIYNALLEPYEKLDDLRMAYSVEEE